MDRIIPASGWPMILRDRACWSFWKRWWHRIEAGRNVNSSEKASPSKSTMVKGKLQIIDYDKGELCREGDIAAIPPNAA